jgi:AraC family transcriptional regulator
MSPDDAINLQVHRRLLPETLRLSHNWGLMDAEHLVMLRPKPHDFTLHSTRHYVALLNAYRKDGETTADELPRSTLRDGRGKLIFIPAGCRLQGWAQPGATPVAFTAAYIDPALCSCPEGGERRMFPMLHFEHPLLVQMMQHLDRILAQPELYSRVYIESFAIFLLSEIMSFQTVHPSRGSRSTGSSTHVKGGLATWQCRAVCDYINANLDQDISLTELAAIAQLSPHHFCRAFKEATGEPPHRYQMSRRIEQAKALLADPSLSITEIAIEVGYNSLSRFSTLFRQITGHSPRSYRRQMN